MDDPERIELLAVLDFFAAAPPDVAEALGLVVHRAGAATAFSIGAHPTMLLFNRVLGFCEQARLAELEAWFASRGGIKFAISLQLGAPTEGLLLERGYRRGPRVMKWRRDVERPAERETSLRIERIGRQRAQEYGAVVATLFGLGAPLDRWFAALCTRPGWGCFGAFDRDRLVGTAAAYVEGEAGWLGAAGTLPEARGRGGQSALLAARIRATADAGARMLACEVVDPVDGDIGPSFRNVARAGFEKAFVQQWWIAPG